MELLGDMCQVEACFYSFADSVCKVGAQYALNIPQAWKSFWPCQMDLLGDVGQIEVHLGLFGDSVNLDTRYVHGLRRTCNRLRNHFGRTRWNF
jgi:hypothetical protein